MAISHCTIQDAYSPRGSRMIMMSKAEKCMDKFRKKFHEDKKNKVVGKSGKSALEDVLQSDAEEAEVANENNNKNMEVVSKSKSWNEVVDPPLNALSLNLKDSHVFSGSFLYIKMIEKN